MNKCDCGCHTSESSSEDMKKNGCDLCYSESEYYPRHESNKDNINETAHAIMNANTEYDAQEILRHRLDQVREEELGKWICSKCGGGTIEDKYSIIKQAREEDRIRILKFIKERQEKGWEDKTILESVINELEFNNILNKP